jgi:hypothetical protein
MFLIDAYISAELELDRFEDFEPVSGHQHFRVLRSD